MPPAMPGKPEGGGGWNVRPTMKEQSSTKQWMMIENA